LAFLDKYERLCMVGVTTRFAVPSLPLLVRQIMIATRIDDIQPGNAVAMGISMVTPSGSVVVPSHGDGIEVSVAGDYILITLRDIPLSEEGFYRFEISMGEQESVVLDVLVRLVSNAIAVDTRDADPASVGLEEVSRPSRRDVN
jgi:hypothetical protein